MGVTPRIAYRADQEEWVIALIQAGLGISIMLEWEAVSGITSVPLVKMQPIRKVGLQWHQTQNFESVNLFRSFVMEGTWFDERFQVLNEDCF